MTDDSPILLPTILPFADRLSPRKRKLMEAAMELHDERDVLKASALGYSTAVLVQAGLPHSNPVGDTRAWVRKNGKFSLVVQPRVLPNGNTTGFPYGSIPRLILAYICSEVVRTKQREVILGKSLSEFMAALGLWNSGGVRGDITRVKEQLYRLVNCDIQFYYGSSDEEVRVTAASNRSIADEYCFWWDRKHPTQLSLNDSVLILTPKFYEEILAHPVPLDMRILQAFKSSSLALDLYTWLTYRVFGLSKPIRISWKALQKQVGSDYSSSGDFRRRVVDVLRELRVFWPELKVDQVHGGMLLSPSPPSVAPKVVPSLTSK